MTHRNASMASQPISPDDPGAGGGRAAAIVMLVVLGLASVTCTSFFPRENWSQKWGPLVPHRTFPGDCGICHVPERWDTMRTDFTFDHEGETGFALVGAHTQAACLRCHNDRGPVAVFMERGCGGCHPDPHAAALGADCEACHVQSTWIPVPMVADHEGTRFPLVGVHAVAPCESCHPRAANGSFHGAQVECHFCHQREAALASPSHVVNGWIVNCEDCHSPSSWRAPAFDHTFFPLVGGHAGLACGQCHPGDRFVPIPATCYSCHQTDYLNAPNHVANGFSINCEDCHNTNAWR